MRYTNIAIPYYKSLTSRPVGQLESVDKIIFTELISPIDIVNNSCSYVWTMYSKRLER